MTPAIPSWRPDLPYNDLPVLPPAGELESRAVLRETSVGRDKLFIHPKLMQLLSRDGNGFRPYG